MHKYLATFKIEFIHFLEYRSEFIAELLAIVVQLTFSAFIALAFYEHKSSIYGYTLDGFITYTLISVVINRIVDTDVNWVMTHQIRKGDLANILVKPFSYNWYRLFAELSWKSHSIFYSFTAIGLISLFYTKYFTLGIILTRIPLFMLAMVISYFLNRAFKYLIGCLAFWTKDTGGISNFVNEVISILSGKWLPLDFFGSLAKYMKLLPFSYIFYFPIQILLSENLTFADILRILVIEVLWTALFTFIGKYFWKKGLKQFEAVGI
ncbi:MAG: ABC-2 family transporter protein [Patescibacteria group bacterium]|nr:ABC-2 family transporter protein [Patescibacteria group bacterium]